MDASTKGLLWVSAVFVAVWLALRYIILRQPIKQSPTYLKAYTGIVGVGWTVGQVIAREPFNLYDGNVYDLVVIVSFLLGAIWAARVSGISWK